MDELLEKFPYLRHLDGVAQKLCRDSRDLSARELQDILFEAWDEIEADAELAGYDIFSEKMPPHFRLNVRALISYLYSIPSASPQADVAQLLQKEKEYGGSWKRRGGVGAFMMGCRKFDRVEFAIQQAGSLEAALAADRRDEGLLDDVGDLRRYLLLWEVYLVEQGAK